jgi:hypothetical protein
LESNLKFDILILNLNLFDLFKMRPQQTHINFKTVHQQGNIPQIPTHEDLQVGITRITGIAHRSLNETFKQRFHITDENILDTHFYAHYLFFEKQRGAEPLDNFLIGAVNLPSSYRGRAIANAGNFAGVAFNAAANYVTLDFPGAGGNADNTVGNFAIAGIDPGSDRLLYLFCVLRNRNYSDLGNGETTLYNHRNITEQYGYKKLHDAKSPITSVLFNKIKQFEARVVDGIYPTGHIFSRKYAHIFASYCDLDSVLNKPNPDMLDHYILKKKLCEMGYGSIVENIEVNFQCYITDIIRDADYLLATSIFQGHGCAVIAEVTNTTLNAVGGNVDTAIHFNTWLATGTNMPFISTHGYETKDLYIRFGLSDKNYVVLTQYVTVIETINYLLRGKNTKGRFISGLNKIKTFDQGWFIPESQKKLEFISTTQPEPSAIAFYSKKEVANTAPYWYLTPKSGNLIFED